MSPVEKADRVAVVTGAAGALGSAMIRRLSADGLKVVAGCGFVVDYLEKHPEYSDMVG